jgi:hypothetical protein
MLTRNFTIFCEKHVVWLSVTFAYTRPEQLLNMENILHTKLSNYDLIKDIRLNPAFVEKELTTALIAHNVSIQKSISSNGYASLNDIRESL